MKHATVKHFIALSLLLALTPLAQAQVYKCHINGKTVFTDQPCQDSVPPARALDIKANPPPPAESAQGEAAEEASELPAPSISLATSSQPVPLLAALPISLLENITRACASQDNDQLLTSIANNGAELRERLSMTEDLGHYLGRLCKQIQTLIDDKLEGNPSRFLYATTYQNEQTLLCITRTTAGLKICSDGIPVILEYGQLKLDHK